jgi:hypothetical protein
LRRRRELMQARNRIASGWMSLGIVAVAWGWCLACPLPMRAQDNAVYDHLGTNTVHSKAFIDASVVQGSRDFCDTIYQVLHSALYTTAVIDARGISSAMTCTRLQWYVDQPGGTARVQRSQSSGIGAVHQQERADSDRPRPGVSDSDNLQEPGLHGNANGSGCVRAVQHSTGWL